MKPEAIVDAKLRDAVFFPGRAETVPRIRAKDGLEMTLNAQGLMVVDTKHGTRVFVPFSNVISAQFESEPTDGPG